MMWRMCELIELADTDARDKLGNRVLSRRVLTTTRARVCPASLVETQNEGNDYAACDLTLITTAPAELALRASLVRFPVIDAGDVFEVIHVSDFGRRRVLSLKKLKGDAYA